LDGADGTAVSRDGKSVYIASSESDSVAAFARNTTTGALTQLAGSAGCVSDTGAGGCVDGTGLDGATSVVVSADGKSVYVVSQVSSSIAVFARNTTSGALTQLGNGGCISETGTGGCTDGTALGALQSITVSPDGTSVYTAAAGGGVAVFSRQTTTTGGTQGKLTQLPGIAGCISETGAGGCTDGAGLNGARSVAVSADGKSVYTTAFNSGAVAAFSRQTTTTGGTKGKLTQLTGTAGCISETGTGGCADGVGLNGLIGLAVSADGKSVYTAAFDGDAVAVFSRQTTTTGGTQGKLTQLTGTAGCIHDTGAGGCADGTALESAISVTVSPDNKSVYATASGGGVAVFARQTTTGGTQGKLTQLTGTAGCIHDTGASGCTDGTALNAPLSVIVTADSKSAYVASFNSDAVTAFSRTLSGGLA
jgi:DNA-binding beta-propeller fold protein YncE